jgi:predicted transcriptional regulator
MTPTDSELDILKVLWARSPLSIREIHDQVGADNEWAISTTRTVVDRMRAKGTLIRDDAHGMAVFSPAQDKVQILGDTLSHVLRNVLQVPGKLSMSAFSGSTLLTAKELGELERLVNKRSSDQ